jgi:hypothetical protein
MPRDVRRCLIAALVLASSAACDRRGAESATFAGTDACVSCHRDEVSAWRTSQHAVAMQVAAGDAVLGRFDGRTLTHGGVTSTFRREGSRFVAASRVERTGEREQEARQQDTQQPDHPAAAITAQS